MQRKEFEKLVRKSLRGMPERVRKAMDNVAIVVEDRPSEDDLRQTGIRYGDFLLGLYQGTPKTSWGRGFGMRLPDKITIFQEPIENLAHSEEKILGIVKNTVWHEVAHHFGMDEKKVREAEHRRQKSK